MIVSARDIERVRLAFVESGVDAIFFTKMERELAEWIVALLNLEITPEEIDPEAPLFGDGLSLDSIDALEIALELSKRYDVEIKVDDDRNEEIFSSLRALAKYVEKSSSDPG